MDPPISTCLPCLVPRIHRALHPVTPLPLCPPPAYYSQTLTLTPQPAQCTEDLYTDAANDFQSVQQLKLCGRIDYLSWTQCDYQVG